MTRKKTGTPAASRGRPPARGRGVLEILASLQDWIAGQYEIARHAREPDAVRQHPAVPRPCTTGGPVSAPVVQLRVPEATLARLDSARGEETRTAWTLRLIDRELTGQKAIATNALITSPSLAALPDGEPSRGAICMGPGCWERSTSKYDLRQLPLCPACRAALEGHADQREIPPSAARLIRRGAA